MTIKKNDQICSFVFKQNMKFNSFVHEEKNNYRDFLENVPYWCVSFTCPMGLHS